MMNEMNSAGFSQSWKVDCKEKGRTSKQKTPQMGFAL